LSWDLLLPKWNETYFCLWYKPAAYPSSKPTEWTSELREIALCQYALITNGLHFQLSFWIARLLPYSPNAEAFANLYPPIDQGISKKTKGVFYVVHRASRTLTMHVAMENKARPKEIFSRQNAKGQKSLLLSWW
jgi:hypothetical protein